LRAGVDGRTAAGAKSCQVLRTEMLNWTEVGLAR